MCMMAVITQMQAQDSPTARVEDLLEDILPAQYEEGQNVSLIYENLIQFYQEPINLNEANSGDLQQLFFLSERQINNLIRYREHFGTYLSPYELLHVPAMHRQTIDLLLHFIVISPPTNRKLALKKRWQEAQNRYLILRQSRVLERQKGYLIADTLRDTGLYNHYPGSPDQLYARMRMTKPGSLSLGLTLEKDAGENIEWKADERKYGADFISAHFQLEKVGPLEQITVGDFTIQSGQQLVFGSGLSLGKGAMTVRSVGRSQQGVRPYTSSVESGFFRGISTTVRLPFADHGIHLTTFFANQPRHAALKYDSTSQLVYFNNPDLSGLHRTDSEVSKRKQLQETAGGLNLFYKNRFENFQAGINLLGVRYGHMQLPRDVLYKKHSFRGHQHQMGSAYYSYQSGHWNSFAEIALSGNRSWGAVAGLSGVLNSYLESVWLYRRYSSGFYNPFGSGFGEASQNTQEEGLYWGLQLEPISRLKIGAFYDIFRFDWMRYRVDAPSGGHEYLLRASYGLSRKTDLIAQYRQEKKAVNLSEFGGAFRPTGAGLRQNTMFILEHRPFEWLRFKTRIHHSSYALADSLTRGWVAAQDVSYTLGAFKADARVALIHTDDFNNRQYLYENDLLYSFTVPAYAGRGIRYYFLLRYKVNRHLSAWLRWSQTVYDDRLVVGSSLDEIEGNRRSQLRTQLIYKF